MSNLPSVAIEEFMQRDLELISETTSAIEAAAHMADKRIGCLVVQGKGADCRSATDHRTGLGNRSGSQSDGHRSGRRDDSGCADHVEPIANDCEPSAHA